MESTPKLRTKEWLRENIYSYTNSGTQPDLCIKTTDGYLITKLCPENIRAEKIL